MLKYPYKVRGVIYRRWLICILHWVNSKLSRAVVKSISKEESELIFGAVVHHPLPS